MHCSSHFLANAGSHLHGKWRPPLSSWVGTTQPWQVTCSRYTMYTHCTSEQNDVDSHPQPCRPRSKPTTSLSTWPIRRITACLLHYISGSHDHFCIGIHMRSDTDGDMAGANMAESHLLPPFLPATLMPTPVTWKQKELGIT